MLVSNRLIMIKDNLFMLSYYRLLKLIVLVSRKLLILIEHFLDNLMIIYFRNIFLNLRRRSLIIKLLGLSRNHIKQLQDLDVELGSYLERKQMSQFTNQKISSKTIIYFIINKQLNIFLLSLYCLFENNQLQTLFSSAII